ncbi:hypothetical protein ED208_06805 [Stagnimonas aquatica]|uniref:Uncharacterized protein n=1 Tax=Stagnimonas aquatica TaxID=2689987 RepID=A0A3N0VH84_9GAMM|nr:hypothetical protein ED208_06805 [Stagnimonas aquatica]
MRLVAARGRVGFASDYSASALASVPTQGPVAGKECNMELALFLTVDVLASIALAAWLGANTGGGHSDWDR